MKASKSTTTLASQKQLKTNGQFQQQQQLASNSAPTSPICRCRVTYLGSSVPHITKDGLQGIQEPLKELYPDKASLDQGNAGIDSWLSVWSNGILIENVDETGREVKRFFKIEALHYCAAVKYTNHVIDHQQQQQQASLAALPKFLPLDSPHARLQQANNLHPPIFASILRRTTGVKVLECHAFICKREAAANALVRCCFHAYADTMYAKQIGAEIDNLVPTNGGQQVQTANNYQHLNGSMKSDGAPVIMARRSKSIAALNDHATTDTNDMSGEYSDSSNRGNLNQQHRQQLQQQQQQYPNGLVHRRKSLNGGNYAQNGDTSDTSQSIYGNSNNNLQKHNFSKSMHQLNQPDSIYATGARPGQDFGDGSMHSNQSTSYHNLSNKHQANSSVPEPFYNPYASRVPSYPPQSIIDQQQTNNTGTLRSVKSVAANSIASTLLRSKKHAKAMSMAQLNNSNSNNCNQNNSNSGGGFNHDRITSFHQPQYLHQHQQAATMGAPGSFLTLPPVPPMFLPNMPRLPQMNGSQTMKLPSRHQQQQLIAGLGPMPPINFEAMTPKEMKKLLKKSAKYGIDPSKFSENGLPILPLRPMPMPPIPMAPMQMPMQMQLPPPTALQTTCHMPPAHMPPPALPQSNKSGTLGSQSLYSMDMHQSQHDMTDYNSQALSYAAAMGLPPPDGMQSDQMQPIKSILVKPNPEFLKSKAGKKWLKQQKEFKKLLPPHLDGLPIVFGPPPLDALEPANASTSNGSSLQPPPTFIHSPQLPPAPPHMQPPASLGGHSGLPMMDSNGYYNPHPFYGPSGRASAASTLLRYSPQSQLMHHQHQQALYDSGGLINGLSQDQQLEFMQRNQAQAMYSDPIMLASQQHQQQQQQKSMMLQSQMLHHPNGNDSNSLLYDQSGSQLNAFDRQYPFGSERLSSSVSSHHRTRRNHMVEQSVISLGDEIDGDEEDEEGEREREDSQRELENNSDRFNYSHNGGALGGPSQGDDNEDHEDGRSDGYYDRVGAGSTQSASQQQQQQHRHNVPRRRHHHKSSSELNDPNRRHDDQMGDYHEPETGLQQQQQQNDDHSGYSSAGIYRRKHINERAFSYSIRQEHKSNGTGTGSNSDADYGTDNGADYSDSRNYHRMASAANPSNTGQNHINNNNNNNNNNHDGNKGYKNINYQQYNQMQHQQRQVQSMTYDSPQVIPQGNSVYQTRGAPPNQPHNQYARGVLSPQQAQADAELSERLKSQLSMKSFSNSAGGLKSHM